MDPGNKDPLLHNDASNQDRFVMFPIRFPSLWAYYKKAVSSFWTAEEIDFSRDKNDYEKLSDNEKHFVKHVLAFFAASDGIVNENLANRFYAEVAAPEAKAFYAFQIAMETIHSETYSLMIDHYISDADEKHRLLRAASEIPCVRRKAEYALAWAASKESPFCERLLAFAVVEGVFFSGSFCAIYWLKERGVLPGLCFSNELISRDEGLHTDYAIHLHGLLQQRCEQTRAVEIVREAVEIEKQFILESLPCELLGMNSELMSQYIEYVADRLLKQLGFPAVWNSRNPFDFMDRIALSNKTNFFEGRVSEYAQPALTASAGATDHFVLDAAF